MLRPVTRQAALDLLDGRAPEGMVFAPGYPSPFSMEVMDLVAGPRSAELANPSVSFFMVRADDGAVIGEIGYFLDEASGTAQIGYSVVEPSWGRGYATEALRALIGHLRRLPGVGLIVADTLVGHAASRRVMEKAGMRYRGDKTGDEGGMIVSLVVYDLVP